MSLKIVSYRGLQEFQQVNKMIYENLLYFCNKQSGSSIKESMSEVRNILKPTRKHFINFVLFLMSIIVIVAIWPGGEEDNLFTILGSLILVSSCYLVLYLFLSHFRSEILEVSRKTFFIIFIILAFVVMTRIVVDMPDRNILYLIPFALIPIVIRTFYDARLALFILLVTIMLAGLIVPDQFIFVFSSFVAGVVAIFSLSNIYRRGRLFFAALMVFICYSVLYTGISLMQKGTFTDFNWSEYKWFLGNGILVLISYPLIFFFEKNFYFLSDTTLLELSDYNQPLLRRLADEAPGSFQHSRQVANLAEEAARVIGANLLLVRTGALYHDIGKIAYPDYFIENKIDGVSPHDNMDPLASSKVIINHVKNGVILAKNFKVPVQIIDFIQTHHGTTVAYYFYKKYVDNHPSEKSRQKEFTYPGPKPFSKETAIVMMADAVEASSRTLDKYTDESISELVERILYLQEQDDQFSNAPLTFKDITDIKTTFKRRLLNIYHSRIVYPERDTSLD